MTEPIPRAELDRAVECALHNVASCVHLMLWQTRRTVAELKAALSDAPYNYNADKLNVVDMILRADGGNFGLNFLTDIGMVLGFDWDFKVRPMPPGAHGESAGAVPEEPK